MKKIKLTDELIERTAAVFQVYPAVLYGAGFTKEQLARFNAERIGVIKESVITKKEMKILEREGVVKCQLIKQHVTGSWRKLWMINRVLATAKMK